MDNFYPVKMRKITINEKNYPELLKKISNPPKELYIEGELGKSEKYPLAVVGTRKVSGYGRQAAEYFVKNLVQSGMTIISGLALGVDGLAHRTTLENRGRTIAVLGSGLDNIYPRTHQKLAKDIVNSGGALISEYAPETKPFKGNFPERNRIISGLSLGVLVIEAPEKSGTLITAEQAIKQKRKVFVIPGKIYDKNSKGANQLIKNGAQLVCEPEDIFKILKIKRVFKKEQKARFLSDLEKILLKFLSEDGVHIDELIQRTNAKTNEIISCLAKMEIEGLVKNLGNGKYIIIKEI